ncbi:MAG: TonB-dependent receptor, partial [Caulobacteraceae bacterium]|nr:TonB-dependent receptor [Caulobacteraceae bacterium]
ERVVGQLDFNDFVASSGFNLGQGISAGNPDLDPQQAWVGEAAAERRFWKAGAATLTYRHSELSDVVDRGPVRLVRVDPVTGVTTVTVFDQPTNIGDGTKDEIIDTLNVPFDHFGWKGALLRGELNRRWSKVTDPTTLTARPISKLRPTEWEVHFSQDLPRHRSSFGVDLVSGWTETSYRFNYIAQTKLHNGFLITWVERRLQPDLVLRLEIDNWAVRGLRYVTKVYDGPRDIGPLSYTDDRYLTPGRAFYVRVRKTFGG